MSEFFDFLVKVLPVMATILAAWFSYNQYTKNKKTDAKIDQWKRGEAIRSERRVEDMASIYAEMYKILHNLKVDRVYIVQPHPLINNLYITIAMEVKRKGVSSMLGQVHKLPMGEIAHFVGQLAKESWIFCSNIEESIIDKKAKAIMSINGTTQVIIRKLTNINGQWVGSLFLENTDYDHLVDCKEVRQEIEEVANNIQFVLPEYKERTI